ncbi:DNA replication/repair protein RecF [Swaminathania salitolerans]|uniref:DNA replication and repair protein RecF n=1 Tax=Swaminathania salitolerans TaxID=182838 RepID=A0A511BVL5_9PROT|nr:DNA replication/repair protein RecF [Swaminathania salitolerans]GBQ15330.1 recombination protein F [Swaminathania salitolerans LMG 21291]GEL02068.1 DNA replication and repair protein RecF [Swaminathania salitolerans]
MRVARLVLTDFRNYERLVWEPQARLSVLFGENGAGKTNLLEALSLLAPGRGLRGAGNSQILRQGAHVWGIAARLGAEDPVSIATGSDPSNPARRLFRLDDMPVRAQSQIAAHCAVTWLTPPMDRLFSDPASGRRRFLDRLVLALDSNHAREAASHERSVSQRNRVLGTHPGQAVWLDGLEDSIARHAVAMTASRLALVEAMNARDLAYGSTFPATRLRLRCAIGALLSERPAIAVEEQLRDALRASRGADRERGATSSGAHRADFALEDVRTGRDATLSSSGQQKAMLVHTILNHAGLLRAMGHASPLILLDEPLVHLDRQRRDALQDFLARSDMAVTMTGTDRAHFAALERHAEFRQISDGGFVS